MRYESSGGTDLDLILEDPEKYLGVDKKKLQKLNIIYLIQPNFDRCERVYKVGVAANGYARLRSYQITYGETSDAKNKTKCESCKGVKVYFLQSVNKSFLYINKIRKRRVYHIENMMKKWLKEKYENVRGTEFFKGVNFRRFINHFNRLYWDAKDMGRKRPANVPYLKGDDEEDDDEIERMKLRDRTKTRGTQTKKKKTKRKATQTRSRSIGRDETITIEDDDVPSFRGLVRSSTGQLIPPPPPPRTRSQPRLVMSSTGRLIPPPPPPRTTFVNSQFPNLPPPPPPPSQGNSNRFS